MQYLKRRDLSPTSETGKRMEATPGRGGKQKNRPLASLWNDFRQNPWQPGYMWPLIVINVTGSVYGYFWYAGQLTENPWYLWLLISDSPLSTTFFALALVFALLHRQIPLLTAVATATTIKYGSWALVILTHYWLVCHDVRPVEIGLWLGHLGMVMEGFIFMRKADIGAFAVAVTLAWMFLNDGVDYILGLHPYLFLPGQEQLAMISAVSITLLTAILIIKSYLSGPGWK